MANLGTLWFGSDIDLSQLKRKISEGNKEILDALKMNYDPQSYSQMVGKIKSELAREKFEIKIEGDTSALRNLQTAIGGISGSGQISLFNIQNISAAQSGISSIHQQVLEFTRQILDQKDVVKSVANDVAVLRERWRTLVQQGGRRSNAAMGAYNDYAAAKKALREEQTALFALQQGRSRANLTLAEQRVAYRAANDAVRAARANLAQEQRARIDAAAALEREKRARKEVQRQLEEERGKLDKLRIAQTRQRTERLQTAMATRQQAQATRQLNSDSIRLNTTLAGGIHISTQLGSALSSVFAIHQARQFLGNVIEIGGQLERQRISIAAILGDSAKANVLFGQIKDLAIKSPFGVVELDQYTKQLSAYGFKYNELYDMTKRLADISAGAGTDIGRLTLALGHVRSATYLTGITLRQFSMNNIPMLKMLADYYTELEGKIVTTAEVQKRISKRQVSYQDVIEQIKRLTDEGGMFYNMQEKISESLSAKFKNLKDAMDIMYGELAESSLGDFLKGVATELTKATRHWKEISDVMAVAVAAFAISKLRIGYNTLAMQSNTAATVKNIIADKELVAARLRQEAITRNLTAAERATIATSQELTAADIRRALVSGQLTNQEAIRLITLKRIKVAQAMHLVGVNNITRAEIQAAVAANRWKVALKGIGTSLKNAFAGIGTFNWVTLGAMVGMELYSSYSNWVDRIDEKTQEMKDLINSRIVDLEKEQKKLRTGDKPKDQAGLKARVDGMKQVLANSEAYTVTLDEQLKNAKDLNEQYDILAGAIDNAVGKEKSALKYQNEINAAIQASRFGSTDFTDNPLVWLWETVSGEFTDSIIGNSTDVEEAVSSLRSAIDGAWAYKDAIRGVIEEMVEQNEVSDLFAERLRNAPLEEQIRLLAESGYWDVFAQKVEEEKEGFASFATTILKTAKKVNSQYYEIGKDDIPKIFEAIAKSRKTSETELRNWARGNIDEFRIMLDGILDQIGQKDPQIRSAIKQMFAYYVMFGKFYRFFATGAQIDLDAESLYRQLLGNPLASITDDTGGKAGGNTGGKNKKDTQLEKWKEELKELKAFWQEYESLLKRMTSDDAVNYIREKGIFPSMFGDGGKLKIDVRGGLKNALSDLLSRSDASTTARKSFQIDIKKEMFSVDKKDMEETADNILQDLGRELEKQGKQWKLYKKLLDATGDRQQSAQIAFGDSNIGFKNMAEQLRARIASELGRMSVSGISIDELLGLSEKDLKKIGIMKDASNGIYQMLEKLRTAEQELKDEEVNLFLNALQNAKSLETELAQIEIKYQRTREAILANGGDAKLLANADANRRRETANKTWEYFKKDTKGWGEMFSNFDRVTDAAISNMIEKLEELLPNITASEEATRSLYEALERLRSEQMNRNPFAGLASAISGASGLRAAVQYMSEHNLQNFAPDESQAKKFGLKSGQSYSIDEIKRMLKGNEADFGKAVKGIAEKFKSMQEVLQPVIDLFETLGETDISQFFQMGRNALGSAASVAGGISDIKGLFDKDSGIGKMLGAAGPYAAAAAAGLSIVSSLFAMHDKSLQKEIEASERRQKEMKNLTSNLEKALERHLGSIYGLKATSKQLSDLKSEIYTRGWQYRNGSWTYGDIKRNYISSETEKAYKEANKSQSYYDTTFAALLAQRDELRRQYESEDDKKKSDAGKLQDYRQQIEEITDEIENFARDMADTLYGIDIKQWASDLGDALFEAWQKGNDGAEAFKKKATEIIADVAKNIATMKLVETAMQPVLDMVVSEMERTDGQLDKQSINAISSAMEAIGTTLPNAFYNLMEGLDAGLTKAGLPSMKDIDSNESPSSIGSITSSISEEVQGLWSSYLNSIRADLSIQRMDVSAVRVSLDALSVRYSVVAEAQTSQLEAIAANTLRNAIATDRIYDIVNAMTSGTGQRKVSVTMKA